MRQATKDREIDYPVAVDNDYGVWSAFANHYWPALYFVDAEGVIRDSHFGEGRYEESERVIQRLLGVERELVAVEGLGVEAEADWDHLQTPETYLGYARGDRHGRVRSSPASGRSRLRMSCSSRPAEASPSGFTRATRISCCPPERASRSPSACCSTGTLPAPPTASTLTRTATACSARAGSISLCANPTRCASGRSKSAFNEPGAEAYAFTFG